MYVCVCMYVSTVKQKPLDMSASNLAGESQADHLSEKPGNVRELYRCQGNVRNFTKSHGNVWELSGKKSCHGKLLELWND